MNSLKAARGSPDRRSGAESTSIKGPGYSRINETLLSRTLNLRKALISAAFLSELFACEIWESGELCCRWLSRLQPPVERLHAHRAAVSEGPPFTRLPVHAPLWAHRALRPESLMLSGLSARTQAGFENPPSARGTLRLTRCMLPPIRDRGQC